MVLLGLRVEFNTIDLNTLLSHLNLAVGIKSAALNWLPKDRSSSVNIGEFSTFIAHLKSGIPPGSILGPLLFSLYMPPLSSIFRKFDIHFTFLQRKCKNI